VHCATVVAGSLQKPMALQPYRGTRACGVGISTSVAKVTKIEVLSALRCGNRVFIRRYCKVADRLFGGNRYERYLEARRREVEECKRKAEECEAKARRLRTSLQRNAEDRFIDRLADESLLNPNFVPPKKRTIQ
jgi:hypothetical protein